jgi:hypothetical protein
MTKKKNNQERTKISNTKPFSLPPLYLPRDKQQKCPPELKELLPTQC